MKALRALDQQRRRVLGAERPQRAHHQIGVEAGEVAKLPVPHQQHGVDAGGEAERPRHESRSVVALIEQRRGIGA